MIEMNWFVHWQKTAVLVTDKAFTLFLRQNAPNSLVTSKIRQFAAFFFFSEALEDYPDQFLIFSAISSTKINQLIERIIETPGF